MQHLCNKHTLWVNLKIIVIQVRSIVYLHRYEHVYIEIWAENTSSLRNQSILMSWLVQIGKKKGISVNSFQLVKVAVKEIRNPTFT